MTPREIYLEAENARLKEKLEYMTRLNSPSLNSFLMQDDAAAAPTVEFRNQPVDFRCVVTGSIEADPCRYHVFVRTRLDGENVKLSYFISRNAVEQAIDPTALAKVMLDKLTYELVGIFSRSR